MDDTQLLGTYLVIAGIGLLYLSLRSFYLAIRQDLNAPGP